MPKKTFFTTGTLTIGNIVYQKQQKKPFYKGRL